MTVLLDEAIVLYQGPVNVLVQIFMRHQLLVVLFVHVEVERTLRDHALPLKVLESADIGNLLVGVPEANFVSLDAT